MTNPDSYTEKKSNIWGKKSTPNFATYLLLFTDLISSFAGKKAGQNFMLKKDDELGNETAYKKKRKGKKKRVTKKFEIDSPKAEI